MKTCKQKTKSAKLDVIELKIPAQPEYISIVRLALSGIASKMAFDYDSIEDIKLAVSEACINISRHAYKGREVSRKEIEICCSIYPDRLDVVVKDRGQGFNPKKIEPYQKGSTATKKESLKLGIFLIKNLMDKVEIKSQKQKGTQVHMVKNLVR